MKIASLKFSIYRFIFTVFCIIFSASFCSAESEKLTILYTGETHSMLYLCPSCPVNISGGLSKRATKIRELRKKNRNVLLLDSGGMFAGGTMDEYSQTVELDKKRTLINLDAVKLMDYDAVAVGDDEFNFGEDFLKNIIKEKGITFLSANIENDYIEPYVLKQVNNFKVGVFALTTSDVRQKLTTIKYIDPEAAANKTVKDLRAKGADIIILLSHLSEEEDLDLVKRVEGIDLLVTGHRLSGHNGDVDEKAGGRGTIILRPTWQGRRLGRVDLEVERGKIVGHKIEDIVIDEKIKDDKGILAILPECFSDKGCRKKGSWGKCKDAATLLSKCVFKKEEPVSILIIKPKRCKSCDIENAVSYFNDTFGKVKISYLNFETRKGRRLVEKLGIEMLPAYLLGKEVEKKEIFSTFKKYLTLKDGKYLLDVSVLGVSFFIGREKKKGRLDLFISLFSKESRGILSLVEDFLRDKPKLKFSLHFLGVTEREKVITPYGQREMEEDLRSVCVMDKYPHKFWDYVSCRAKNIESTWWDDCLESSGISITVIKECSGSRMGRELLLDNIRLSSDLNIMSSGTFLIDNQEVFSTLKVPKKEELERMIR
ncbi:MAG TPA: hypothetical protein ENH41_03605 [Candidatus Omnitrophica bacterium]|nr:hypothetical protein [Candidatus Omnitrophota bacterium]